MTKHSDHYNNKKHENEPWCSIHASDTVYAVQTEYKAHCKQVTKEVVMLVTHKLGVLIRMKRSGIAKAAKVRRR